MKDLQLSEYKPGQVVFRQGDEGGKFYFVLTGKVRLRILFGAAILFLHLLMFIVSLHW